MSVDGTEFLVQLTGHRGQWYSHKFKYAGYRYEVAVCIQTGWIVWTNGPFPAGANADLTVFRKGLKKKLLWAKEKALADLGYRGEPRVIILPNEMDSKLVKKLKKDVAARHETINRRLKQFGILKQQFRHGLEKHQAVFEACAVLTQICIVGGEEPYQTQYGHLPLCLWRRRRDHG